MEDWEKENMILEEKYYPITWEIDADSEIKIWDFNVFGKKLKNHKYNNGRSN